MHRHYQDNFNDRNSHNVEIGSRNHINIREIANSPAATIATCFAVLLIGGVIIFLWTTYHSIAVDAVFAILGFIALKMINHTVRDTSRTIFSVNSDIKQRKIIYRGEHIVLYEDDLDTIRAIRDREEQVNYRIDQGAGPSGFIESGADTPLKPIHQMFRRRDSLPEEEDFEDELG